MGERRSWTRDELLIAFNLYCKTSFGRTHGRNPEIIQVASTLKRTPGAVAMKLVNFASLDPTHQARHVRGLGNVSRSDRLIFDEFVANWEALAYESEAALQRLTQGIEAEPPEKAAFLSDGATETFRRTRVRLVQRFFRRSVLVSYEHQCAVCAIQVPSLLNASHIIPWAQSIERRADPTNGIAMCSLHDRAFDRGLITVDDELRLVVSSRLRKDSRSHVHRAAFIAAHGQSLIRPVRFQADAVALRFHRETLFKGD